MGRVGSCLDNAAAESFFSTLEWEVLSRQHFTTREQARAVVTAWAYEFYNQRRRHSSADMMSPIDYENSATRAPSGISNPPRFEGKLKRAERRRRRVTDQVLRGAVGVFSSCSRMRSSFQRRNCVCSAGAAGVSSRPARLCSSASSSACW
jgi:hypothetical protein